MFASKSLRQTDIHQFFLKLSSLLYMNMYINHFKLYDNHAADGVKECQRPIFLNSVVYMDINLQENQQSDVPAANALLNILSPFSSNFTNASK